MTTHDRDNQTGDELGGLLGGLEQLAEYLDVQEYPGQAWPAASPRPSRRLTWKIAASLAAAAAIVVMVVHYGITSHPPIGPAPRAENAVALAPALSGDYELEELTIPEILIVEDLESYSIIDLTSGVPLVSFATKDSYSPVCVVPLLPGEA